MGKQVQWVAFAVLVACSLDASAAPTWKKGMTIPVVTEGSVCKSAIDKIAVTSTNQILSCQSGLWAKAQGGSSSTGMKGVYLPLAGKAISCYPASGGGNVWYGTFSAMVDMNGQVYVRAAGQGSGYIDTGWVAGYEVTTPWPSSYFSTAVGLDGLVGTVANDPYLGAGSTYTCTARWPQT